MNVIIGLGVLALAGGFAVALVGLFLDRERLLYGGGAVACGVCLLALAGFGLAMMLGFVHDETLVEGRCYRAVRHSTTTVIPVGKVLVPSTTSGVDLLEIECPR